MNNHDNTLKISHLDKQDAQTELKNETTSFPPLITSTSSVSDKQGGIWAPPTSCLYTVCSAQLISVQLNSSKLTLTGTENHELCGSGSAVLWRTIAGEDVLEAK